MPDLKSQVRDMAGVISAAEADAAKARGALKSLMSSAQAEGADLTTGENFDKIDAAGKTYDAARQTVAELKSNRERLLAILADGADTSEHKTSPTGRRGFGAEFTKSDAYQAMRTRLLESDNVPLGATASVKMGSRAELKTLITSTQAISPLPDRTDTIVAKPLVSVDFLSVIAAGETDSDVVEWLEETTFTNSAAETAEGSAYAESADAFTKRTANVKAIGHFLPVTRRAASDQAFLESWINDRLIEGVRQRLQTQVLSGGGTGEDLTGIYTNGSIGSVDRSTTTLNMLDSLHRCITTIRTNSFVEPDFVGIHPVDYEAMAILRTGGSAAGDGIYLYGNPATGGPLTIWGVPALVHAGFTSGSPLVGRGKDAELWVREGISVSASDSHSDYFTKRIVTLLAETRVAFGVLQPKSFCQSVA